ncbi:MAG: translation initiation factor 2, partial [Tabrizicola sp.]|nr:translation initiation factor 2 [Tabrizicola sp.]
AAVREPEPEVIAAAKPEEIDEANEPEVASAAPRIPTKASVAKQATYENAINLSKTNLIGVYGTQNNRYALVRQSNGRYKKVSVGDRIDGGTVKAITQNEVRYQKGGRLIALKMPKA